MADFRNDRLRCRAPPAHAAAERVVQCRAPRRSRSSPPTPSPRRAALPVRERWLRERLRGASRRRPQRGRCRFRCRRSVVQGHLGRSRAAGRPDRARGIGLHPAVSMGQQSSTASGQGLDRDREYADPALIGRRDDGRQGQLRRRGGGPACGGHRTGSESTSPGGAGCVCLISRLAAISNDVFDVTFCANLSQPRLLRLI